MELKSDDFMIETLIKQDPYVDNSGMWMPIKEYAYEGLGTAYRCIMTKEMFVEAYNRWIAHNTFGRPYNDDDADCWCE